MTTILLEMRCQLYAPPPPPPHPLFSPLHGQLRAASGLVPALLHGSTSQQRQQAQTRELASSPFHGSFACQGKLVDRPQLVQRVCPSKSVQQKPGIEDYLVRLVGLHSFCRC